jgi:hypothetical protein
MESYPQHLLVGVVPLVFAINTISNDCDAQQRKLFDKLLDALAAVVDHEDGGTSGNNTGSGGLESNKSRRLSLFRPSSEDDASTSSEDLQQQQQNSRGASGSSSFGFGRLRNSVELPPVPSTPVVVSSYAAKTHGFFFRMETVLTTHGFPPSKDPHGTDNLAHTLPPLLMSSTVSLQQLQSTYQQHAMQGILPAGWLEKHAHALPSVILVVCTSTMEQDAVAATIQHLQQDASLAPKRSCAFHIVVFDNNYTNPSAAAATSVLEGNSATSARVTTLHANDLEPGPTGATSPALRQLHERIRDSSRTYYARQARRTKDKLHRLVGAHNNNNKKQQDVYPEELLPLVIRYCFKLALFSEFQWRHDASLRRMAEAYRHVVRYYAYLNAAPPPAETEPVQQETVADVSRTKTTAQPILLDGSIWKKLIPAPQPNDDRIHQCRAVAEWLNLKLLQAGLASHTPSGLLAAADQWRHHSRTFCNNTVRESTWLEWAYTARNRLVMSQLTERHPPPRDFNQDAIVLRCSPWRNYEATVEATLQLATELDKVKANGQEPVMATTTTDDKMRPPFVGGLDSHGLAPELMKLIGQDHRGTFDLEWSSTVRVHFHIGV